MIQYRFALDASNDLVDVFKLTPESRHALGPYRCLSCHRELIPKLGPNKAKHFGHKVVDTCSRITYLHHLAQSAFVSTYTRCVESGIPFLFKMVRPSICNHHQSKLGDVCATSQDIEIDLTEHFPYVAVEKGYKGFVPDILLSSEKGEALLVEIAVTHPCEPKKIALGDRILELQIDDEDDIEPILAAAINEDSDKVVCYNFKKKTFQGDVCSGQCSRKANLFLVYQSQKSVLAEVNPSELSRHVERGPVTYSEVLGFASPRKDQQIKTYRHKVRETHFKGVAIKSCFLCKYHGGDGIENAVFCKLRKASFGSNEATECPSYRTFQNMQECEAADRANDDYARKNRSSTATNLFMRIIDRHFP